jgi:hypothetical protein
MALLSFTGSPHGGRQRHLPEWQSQPRITPTTIIDHTIVGTGEQGYQHFLNRSALESHFIVENDGAIWQLMDTDRQADANLDANSFAISIETGDRGDPDNQPWTQAQLDSLIWLHEQLRRVHPTIPRQKCPTWNGGGLGYHTLFGAPSHWTPVAKSCPGRIRKIQWAAELLPAFLHPETEEDDMSAEAEAQIKSIYDGMVVPGTASVSQAFELLFNRVKAIEQGMVVPGTTSVAEAFELLFARVRTIEATVTAAPEPLLPIEGEAVTVQVDELAAAAIAQDLATNADFLRALAEATAAEVARRLAE